MEPLAEETTASTPTVASVTAALEGAPTVAEPIVDRARLPGEPFAFRLHPDTFFDPNGDPLVLGYSLASGAPAPDWLTFDGSVFRGEAPAGFDASLDIRVTASDGTSSVDDVFTLTIGPDAPVLEFDVRRAINLGNALDAPNEGDWGYVIAEEHVQEIADKGFDSVRLAVRWSGHIDDDNIIDPLFFQRVEEVIGWALERDLNVVVDLHHFWELNDDPLPYIPALKSIWSQIATRFADMPSNVYFELFNEPHGAFDGDLVDDTMAELVDIIRETNPTRAIVVGGEDWYSVNGLLQLTLPNDDYIVPTFHYYVPFDFTHQGAPFVNDPPPVGREWGSPEDLQQLAENFALIAEWREQQGDMPVFMGEFGAYFEIPDDERSEWATDVRNAAEGGDIVWSWWAFHTIYDVFDQGTGTWNQTMLDALIVSSGDNAPPVATADAPVGPEDTPIQGRVTAIDPDGDPVTFARASDPAHGAVTVRPDGTYTYTPALNYFGADSFDVTASDGRGGTDRVTVGVTVTPVNDPPSAPDETATGVANTALAGQLAATDPDGDTLVYALASAAAHGTATVGATGGWSYTPAPDFTGDDSFGYLVDDGQGGVDSGTVFLTIGGGGGGGTYVELYGTAGNDLLEGADDRRDALYGLAGDDTLLGRGGDDLLDGDGGIDRLEGGPGNDILRAGTGDDRVFGDAGEDVFEFAGGSDRAVGGADADTFVMTPEFLGNGRTDKAKVADYEAGLDIVDLGGAAVASYSELANRVILTLDSGDIVELIGVSSLSDVQFASPEDNAPPVATADAPVGPEDTPIQGRVTAIDPDGDPVTFARASDPAHGAVTVRPDGTYTYTPALNYFGADSFDVTASDGRGGTDRVTVGVTVTPVNDPPSAPDETATGVANTALAGQLAATDPDGDTLVYALASAAAHGTATVGATGGWSYTPAPDFTGDDSFGYLVDDGQGGVDSGTVFLTIGGGGGGGTYVELYGTAGNDLLEGADDRRDALYGLAGDDTLLGRGGDDLLDGDGGIDRLEGGPGNDILRAGTGDDRVFGDAGEDVFEFAGGSDRAVGGADADTFVMTPEFLGNGRTDKAKVADYEAGLDIVDLGGATVASYSELANRVLITVGADADVVELIGINSIGQVVFAEDIGSL